MQKVRFIRGFLHISRTGETYMSQVQVQTPKFEIFSWGSCRRGYLDIIYPKKVSLLNWTWRRGEHEVEIPQLCKIRYYNADSSKNYHRTVEVVDLYTTIVLNYHGAHSCSRSFREIYVVRKVNGQLVFEKPQVKSETAVVEKNMYRVTVEREYIEVDGQRVYTSEHVMDREVCIEKLRVKVVEAGEDILVHGDTYHIKEKLKALGYKWHPESKTWYKKKTGNFDKYEAIRELEELGVEVVTE
jgi:hypothetical protein